MTSSAIGYRAMNSHVIDENMLSTILDEFGNALKDNIWRKKKVASKL